LCTFSKYKVFLASLVVGIYEKSRTVENGI